MLDKDFTCDLCGKQINKDDIFHFIYPDNALACETCAEQICFCCDDCGHYWHTEYLSTFDDGDWLCPDCLGLSKEELENFMRGIKKN